MPGIFSKRKAFRKTREGRSTTIFSHGTVSIRKTADQVNFMIGISAYSSAITGLRFAAVSLISSRQCLLKRWTKAPTAKKALCGVTVLFFLERMRPITTCGPRPVIWKKAKKAWRWCSKTANTGTGTAAAHSKHSGMLSWSVSGTMSATRSFTASPEHMKLPAV